MVTRDQAEGKGTAADAVPSRGVRLTSAETARRMPTSRIASASWSERGVSMSVTAARQAVRSHEWDQAIEALGILRNWETSTY